MNELVIEERGLTLRGSMGTIDSARGVKAETGGRNAKSMEVVCMCDGYS